MFRDIVLVLGVSVGLFSFVLDGGWSVRAFVRGVLAIPSTAGAFLAFWVTSKFAPRPPVLGGGVALLAFGLPLIVIAPTVARGDAQGGLFYFALPFFQCLAALAGAGFGGLLAYARDRIAILRRPAAGRVAQA